MRLFLFAVLTCVLAGCHREDSPSAAAIRIKIYYATFHPACLRLTATDKADASRTETSEVDVVAALRSDERTVAVFRKDGWSRDLKLALSAHERNCDGPVVASQELDAQVPESGLAYVSMELRAEDLDGDGYVSTAQGGTDCDDGNAAVHPGATEMCDGVDNNCVDGEADAEATSLFFVDADGDGYGDFTKPVYGCLKPAGTVSNSADCNDGDASVHPDQEELLCDGRDEDCDGTADDVWSPGVTCTTADGCAGAMTCKAGGTSGAACQATQAPSVWYVDTDGDGKAGERMDACVQPAGSVTTQADCDEDSPFAYTGAAEVCDRLDNNCKNGVDEGASTCNGYAWRTQEGLPDATASWRAVAAYGAFGSQQAWLAGSGGKLVLATTPTNFIEFTTCAGDWRSAWARPSDGRVFLGSADGKLATTTPQGGGCDVVPSPSSTSINGLVGFEGPSGTTVFAVTSDGRILRWNWTSNPTTVVEVTRVPANLRSVHGTSPDTLLAVGAEDFNVSVPVPRVFRAVPGSGDWVREELPANVPAVFLRGVHVLTGKRAYAVGDSGVVLERTGSTWTKVAAPPSSGGVVPDLRGVVAFGKTAVYAVSHLGEVLRYDAAAGTWTSEIQATRSLYAIGGADPRDVWAVGDSGAYARWSK